MNQYQRVEKPREERPYNENEIRITTQGRIRGYITYATSLLQEKGFNKIVFKAMGRAINKTVVLVELTKRMIAGLHQNTVIGSTDITESWVPLEEGLLPLETTRHVSTITITLSKQVLDRSSVGYQPPLLADRLKPHAEYDYEDRYPTSQRRGRGGRSRGRGRGNGPVIIANGDGGEDTKEREFGRGGLSLSRGRGFRGRGRGRLDYQQEANGYLEEPPAPLERVERRGNGPVIIANGDGGGDTREREFGRGGSSLSRGRGFRGRGRSRLDYQKEANGYLEEPPAPLKRRARRPRGRGRGDARSNGSINAGAAEA